MRSVELTLGEKRIPTWIGHGEFDSWRVLLAGLDADRWLILTDTTVLGLYRSVIEDLFPSEQSVVVTVPPGESEKSLANISHVLQQFFAAQPTKRSVVVCIGGGIVLNMGGLVAGCMFRGIRLLYVPTTLTAQHDVITSLKTGFNFAGRKNCVGMFYPSVLNLVDTSFLQTESRSSLRSGIGELVKNALLLGGEHFDFAQDVVRKFQQQSLAPADYVAMVQMGIDAKNPFLQQDERERTSAMIFEYGHTLAHALEICYATQGGEQLLHGEYVCYGMALCSYVAEREGLMSATARARHDALIYQLVEPTLPAPMPTLDEIVGAVLHDSKRGVAREAADEVACVLLRDIGRPIEAPHMLSTFPARYVRDWYVAMALQAGPTLQPAARVQLSA